MAGGKESHIQARIHSKEMTRELIRANKEQEEDREAGNKAAWDPVLDIRVRIHLCSKEKTVILGVFFILMRTNLVLS